jgi:signal transduction histidine kinase
MRHDSSSAPPWPPTEPVDLAALSAELAHDFYPACARAGLSLSIDCEEMPQPVFVNEQMWRMIVLKLLVNAFDSTFRGAIRIKLVVEGEYAVLQVSHTGWRGSADDAAKTRRHPRNRSRTAEGVDLSPVHQLVALHNGTTDVQNVPGGGSVFTVRIPLGFSHPA